MSPDLIYHITTKTAWDAALETGSYTADSYATEGFIHASTGVQYIATANRYYRGTHGLVLLVIDRRKVAAEVRYENLVGGAELFPHIYGPLNLEAVLRVEPFEPNADGIFEG
jgi:uncharacterized protein (DUF952 family)